ncbi:hypothetical protein ACRYCC_09290 [Actinomadura scrupuli]|uniref:hypothetical protein n=1 Tax=Actinomadura scrupuli TaxID=559629 RepID=UPI003D96C094
MVNNQWRRLVQLRVLDKRQILASDVTRDPTLVDGFPHPYIFLAVGRRLRLQQLFAAVETLESRGWTAVSWHLVAETRGVVMRHRPPVPPEPARPPTAPHADEADPSDITDAQPNEDQPTDDNATGAQPTGDDAGAQPTGGQDATGADTRPSP